MVHNANDEMFAKKSYILTSAIRLYGLSMKTFSNETPIGRIKYRKNSNSKYFSERNG